MIQKYDLLRVLDIPNPHDCVIERITQDKDCFIFQFEDNITKNDSAKFYCPSAKSLIVRYYPLDMDYCLYLKKTRKRKEGFISSYTSMESDALFHLTERKYVLEYLYHYTYYGSLILVLWSRGEFRLEFPDIKYVEYNWIE